MTHFNTTFIDTDRFVDLYEAAKIGATITYVTGDLAQACNYFEDARALRQMTQDFEKQRKIVLTQHKRHDLKMNGGGCAFEYRATKRDPKKPEGKGLSQWTR